MVLELKLRNVVNSVGLGLPKEVLARLNVGEGDTLTLTDTPGGGLQVAPATKGRAQKITWGYPEHGSFPLITAPSWVDPFPRILRENALRFSS